MSTPLPQAPNPLSQRQTRIWYVAMIVASIGMYFVMREGGADFKETFVQGVYVACVGTVAWLLRKYILSQIKDRG